MKFKFALRFCLFGGLFLLLTAERCVEITEIDAPNYVSPGAAFQAKTRLKHLMNDGTSFNLDYYLSYDRIWNPEDRLIGSKGLTDFPQNTARQVDQTLLIPATTFFGKYYLIAKAQDGEMFRPVQVNGPINIGADLVPAELLSYGGTGPGEVFRFSFSLFNRGMQAVDHSAVRCYLSTDLNIDPADRLVYTVPVSSPMGAGGIRDYTGLEFDIPDDLPTGDYYFTVVADATNVVSETVETNNSVSKLIHIDAGSAGDESESRALPTETAPNELMPALALGPNPATDFVVVSGRFPQEALFAIEVLDLSGRPFYSLSERRVDAGDYTQRIDLAGRPAGIYIVRVRVNGRDTVHKIVKQ